MVSKGMTLGSLFDGSGGFPLAGALNGITPVWASEIEPYPIAVTTSHFPQMKHYGDVSAVNGAEIQPVDIVTFGSPCFPKDTLVFTKDGYKPIQDIEIGDEVMTHRCNWKKVSATGSKLSKTVLLKGNHYGIVATPNHPFYSGVEQWTPAENMAGKFFATPNTFPHTPIPSIMTISNKEHDTHPIDEQLMYIVGRWIGDGWVRDGQRSNRPIGQKWGQVFICCGKNKVDTLDETIRKFCQKVHRIEERTVYKYQINNKAFCRWLTENFGRYAHGKKLPAWVFSMPRSMREALLRGYKESDGNVVNDHLWRATTVSKELAHGLRLLGESLDYSTSVYFAKRKRQTTIEGRTVNQRDTYTVSFNEHLRFVNQNELHNWHKCKSVVPYSECQTVYNITVEEDHSYIVEGVVVHNCQDMSVAGTRSGMKHEEHGDDETTRSGLFYEAVRIIREMREATDGQYPTFAVWENVPGAFSSNSGDDFHCVLCELARIAGQDATIPKPPKWVGAGLIEGDGWSIAWRTLDAQYFGVPQRRKRIYLVADFDGKRARDILFERESVRGDSSQSGETRENSSCDAERSTRRDGSVKCLNAYDVQSRRIFDTKGHAPTLQTGTGGGTESPAVVFALQGNGIDRALTAGCNGAGWREDQMYTLNTVDRHAVGYTAVRFAEYAEGIGTLKASGGDIGGGSETLVCYDARGNGDGATCPTLTGDHENRITDYTALCVGNGQLNQIVMSEKSNALDCMHDKQAVLTDGNPPRKYIVRRLTPTECARLQGFPDRWGDIDMLDAETMSDEETAFWRQVRDTHATVNGKTCRLMKDKEAVAKWHNGLHTDSAEYKMWGNGIALPCADFVLGNIIRHKE